MPNTNLTAAARKYAENGWAIFPCNGKQPLTTHGYKDATTNVEQIDQWWAKWPDANIGFAVPDGLIVIDIDNRSDGWDGYRDLEHQAGVEFPETWIVETGSDEKSVHLYYRVANTVEADKIVNAHQPGVDIKRPGRGYVILPPSIHPTSGKPYRWEPAQSPTFSNAGIMPDPADLPPQALAALTIHVPTHPEPARHVQHDEHAPIARYNTTHSVHDLLVTHGWQPHPSRPDGRTAYTRPGKDPRHGLSAISVDGSNGQPGVQVFTSSDPILKPGKYDAFDLHVLYEHAGDRHRAIDTCKRETPVSPLVTADQPPETSSSYRPLDLALAMNGDQLNNPPTVLRRADNATALLYPGLVHALYGEPESGKSWVALAACVEQIQAGQQVVYIDYEDSPRRIVGRLQSLGATRDEIIGQFHYIRPGEPFNDTARFALNAVLNVYEPTLVILDAITEAMTLDGLNAFTGADKDYPEWHNNLARFLATTGAAVLLLDHVTKNKETRGRWAAGTQHKLSALDGAAYSLETVRPFGRGRSGLGKLHIGKDRPGHVREFQTGRDLIAEVHLLTLENDGVAVELRPPSADDDGNFRPTFYMEQVSKFLENPLVETPTTSRELRSGVEGSNNYIDQAVNQLLAEGYVKAEPGPRGARHFTLIKAFRGD